jgi:succinylarginine dihydrolase
MGIDAGAFHSDVLSVGSGSFLMLHEAAFVDTPSLLEALRERLESSFGCCLATTAELPLDDAVRAYPFNSQLLALPNGELCLVAPRESEENAASRRYLERVVAENNPVSAVHYVDVNASMNNGGGPACLRLRVALSQAACDHVSARVFYDAALHAELRTWIERHYRDRLMWEDLADPRLLDEGRTALDELTQILRIGSVYEFQQPA